jgi:hypothetical protein
LPFIKPIAWDAPEWVFVSARMSKLAFLLCLVIVFSHTDDRYIPDQC